LKFGSALLKHGRKYYRLAALTVAGIRGKKKKSFQVILEALLRTDQGAASGRGRQPENQANMRAMMMINSSWAAATVQPFLIIEIMSWDWAKPIELNMLEPG